MALNIFLLEDEPKVQRFIKKALEQAGMQVECVGELEAVEDHLRHLSYDVVILDRLIANRDSLAIVGKLKKMFPQIRILILSALGELDDRVTGLEMGADDYLSKPFHVTELVARVKSLARRGSEGPEGLSILKYLDVVIRLSEQEVVRADKNISLTAKEFKLLTLMAQKPHKIFSKTELMDRVWGLNADPESNVVEVTVNRLRSKIDDGHAVPLIHTKRGSGYWFGESTAND